MSEVPLWRGSMRVRNALCESDALQTHITESVYKVALQESIPAQFRQLVLYISNDKGQVDGSVGE